MPPVLISLLMVLCCAPMWVSSTSFYYEPPPCQPINVGYEVGDTHVAFARGCYHSSGSFQSFPAGSSISFRGTIDWSLWAAEGSAKQIIVQCAKVALERGAPTFGVEFYGECYYGADPDLSQGAVTTDEDCNTHCYYDVGAANVVFIYDLFEWYTE